MEKNYAVVQLLSKQTPKYYPVVDFWIKKCFNCSNMSTSPSAERMVGYVPYPEGAVLPSTCRDAIEETIRYLGTQHPWDEVREQVRNMDPNRVFDAARGIHISEGLNLVEKFLAGTLDYCGRTGLLRNPVEAVTTVASVKFDVNNDRFFIDKESPSKPHINPTT